MDFRRAIDLIEALDRSVVSAAPLVDWAEQNCPTGVELKVCDLDWNGRRVVTTPTMAIQWIERKTDAEPGSVVTFLRALCAKADELGTTIRLGVERSKPRLLPYYKQFGFKRTDSDREFINLERRMKLPAQPQEKKIIHQYEIRRYSDGEETGISDNYRGTLQGAKTAAYKLYRNMYDRGMSIRIYDKTEDRMICHTGCPIGEWKDYKA